MNWREYNLGAEFLPKKQIKKIELPPGLGEKKFVLEAVPIFTEKTNSGLDFRIFSFVDKHELYKFEDWLSKKKSEINNFLCLESYKYIDHSSFVESGKWTNFIELKSIGINPEKSSYLKNKIQEISRTSKYKFSKNVDLSSFYESIYTHSFEFLDDSMDGEKMDEYNRNINGRMTKGIITGVLTSKISSEIILTFILKKMGHFINEKKSKEPFWNTFIYRFADDFTFYYNYRHEFEILIKEFIRILNSLKLSINKSKYNEDFKIFNQSFNTISANYDDDDVWSLKINEIEIKYEDKKDVVNKIKKTIISSLSDITDHKTKQSFYVYTLKCLGNIKTLKKLSADDKEFLKIIIDFSLNFISTEDRKLNIPHSILSIVCEENLGKYKYYILESILEIYVSTNSELKKIFIMDILFNNYKIDELKEIIKESNVKFSKHHLIHLSQLLEMKLINFNNIKKELEILKPEIIHKRLSKEWVVWLYSEDSQDGDKELKIIKKYKDFFKPFDY